MRYCSVLRSKVEGGAAGSPEREIEGVARHPHERRRECSSAWDRIICYEILGRRLEVEGCYWQRSEGFSGNSARYLAPTFYHFLFFFFFSSSGVRSKHELPDRPSSSAAEGVSQDRREVGDPSVRTVSVSPRSLFLVGFEPLGGRVRRVPTPGSRDSTRRPSLCLCHAESDLSTPAGREFMKTSDAPSWIAFRPALTRLLCAVCLAPIHSVI